MDDLEADIDRVRIGAVSYTNTLPLIHGLGDAFSQTENGYSLALDTPRALADSLAAGELDVALIPVAEFLRGGYELLQAGCISSLGPVRSVYIASRKPVSQCRRLLLDGASRSSVALSRVLFQHLWGASPEMVDPGAPTEDLYEPGRLPFGCDAALVIGDRALKMAGRFPVEEDLSSGWFELTNLPFVFAVWAVRPGACLRDVPQLLCAAKRRARSEMEPIAAGRARELGLPADYVLEYLSEYIRYRLGDRELAAIEMFYRLLRDMDLCPPIQGLKFYADPLPRAGCSS